MKFYMQLQKSTGTCALVISPLQALIHDQVERWTSRDVKCRILSTDCDEKKYEIIIEDIYCAFIYQVCMHFQLSGLLHNDFKILFASPKVVQEKRWRNIFLKKCEIRYRCLSSMKFIALNSGMNNINFL